MQVLFICFAVSTLSYGFMGIIGYLMYGDALMSQVTLNLPSGKVSSKIAIYTTLVNPLTKYALVMAPIAEAIEGTLGVRKSRLLRALVRTALVVGTAVIALAVPFFADVVALTGALLSCTATMLLPSLCYLRVRAKVGYKKPWLETAACVAIAVVGTAIVALGTFSSVKQIVQRLK
jgi:vesicular inhibitory amino acid transporter